MEGEEKFPAPTFEDLLPDDRYECVDWEAEKVDIEREFTDEDRDEPLVPKKGHISIHQYLKQRLKDSHDIVFYDHTQGEAADYISFRETDGHINCELYHCKSSGGKNAGARSGDIYEICGQAIKCLRYLNDLSAIVEHVKRRNVEVQLPHYVKGDNAELDDMSARAQELGFRFEVVLVQPGISKAKVNSEPDKARLLTGCDRYLVQSGAEFVRIMASE